MDTVAIGGILSIKNSIGGIITPGTIIYTDAIAMTETEIRAAVNAGWDMEE